MHGRHALACPWTPWCGWAMVDGSLEGGQALCSAARACIGRHKGVHVHLIISTATSGGTNVKLNTMSLADLCQRCLSGLTTPGCRHRGRLGADALWAHSTRMKGGGFVLNSYVCLFRQSQGRDMRSLSLGGRGRWTQHHADLSFALLDRQPNPWLDIELDCSSLCVLCGDICRDPFAGSV